MVLEEEMGLLVSFLIGFNPIQLIDSVVGVVVELGKQIMVPLRQILTAALLPFFVAQLIVLVIDKLEVLEEHLAAELAELRLEVARAPPRPTPLKVVTHPLHELEEEVGGVV